MKINTFYYNQEELKRFLLWIKKVRKSGIAVQVSILDDLTLEAVTEDGRTVFVRPWMARDILEDVYAEMMA